MDQKDVLRQMIQYNKTVFENSFSSLTMVQDQMEKAMDMFMKQSAWLPEEGKKVCEEYSQACRKARENFKKAVDEGFKKVEGFFGGAASA